MLFSVATVLNLLFWCLTKIVCIFFLINVERCVSFTASMSSFVLFLARSHTPMLGEESHTRTFIDCLRCIRYVFAKCKRRKTLTTTSACFLLILCHHFGRRRLRCTLSVSPPMRLCANNFADDDTFLKLTHLCVRAQRQVALSVMPYSLRCVVVSEPTFTGTLFALCDAMIILFNEFLRQNSRFHFFPQFFFLCLASTLCCARDFCV